MDIIHRDVAEPIRKGRLRAGLTQAQVAEAVGVTNVAVSKWENGVHTPWRRHGVRLELILGLPAGSLSTHDEKKRPKR